jgi:hypothetical protein
MISQDNEWAVFKDFEGAGRDLFQDIAPEFVWRDWIK